MANGLLEHPKQNQEWEDVGKRYLNELLSRCLIQMEQDFWSYFTFKMHDLVHDLALDVSQKECKTVNSEAETVDENVRHLLLCDGKLVGVPRVLEEMKNVRTVIIQDASVESKTTYESLTNLSLQFQVSTSIRIKEVTIDGFTKFHWSKRELPRSFDKLRRLQSLNLGGTGLKQLPDSVQRLIELRHLVITIKTTHLKEIRAGCWTSLQYLELRCCMELECLPEGMQYLKSLRTLVLKHCDSLVSLPRSLKFLSKLEHLEIVGCLRINLKMELEEEEKDLQLSLKTLSLTLRITCLKRFATIASSRIFFHFAAITNSVLSKLVRSTSMATESHFSSKT
ncbi:putative disease resistance protein RGA3 [Gossypium raimondii]|uniref:putative disease resistance protein RGA3 n=1 Tax=Gossypium raimondii TaxID=29730 RepID=UPI00227C75EC|nr:putative disease resistance protein RGA3 [Gossypium raimondii]